MNKAHEVEIVGLTGTVMTLRVDGKQFRVDLAAQSPRLAHATQSQRDNFELGPRVCELPCERVAQQRHAKAPHLILYYFSFKFSSLPLHPSQPLYILNYFS